MFVTTLSGNRLCELGGKERISLWAPAYLRRLPTSDLGFPSFNSSPEALQLSNAKYPSLNTTEVNNVQIIR